MTAIAINKVKKKRAIFGKRFKMTVGGTILAIAVLGAIFGSRSGEVRFGGM